MTLSWFIVYTLIFVPSILYATLGYDVVKEHVMCVLDESGVGGNEKELVIKFLNRPYALRIIIFVMTIPIMLYCSFCLVKDFIFKKKKVGGQ